MLIQFFSFWFYAKGKTNYYRNAQFLKPFTVIAATGTTFSSCFSTLLYFHVLRGYSGVWGQTWFCINYTESYVKIFFPLLLCLLLFSTAIIYFNVGSVIHWMEPLSHFHCALGHTMTMNAMTWLDYMRLAIVSLRLQTVRRLRILWHDVASICED